MQQLFIAGLAPVIPISTTEILHDRRAQPLLLSGLGQGFCWAKKPYPDRPVMKLTNRCNRVDGNSCSPFHYRPFQKNLDGNLPNPCKGNPYLDIIAGAKFKLGARTWASFPAEKRTDYWVFHNCDGAGIQPDCIGDIQYIERFDGPSSQQPGCEKGPHGRNHCTFTHPNSGSTFGRMKYWAGWYNYGKDLETGNLCGAGGNLDRPWNKNVCHHIQSINNGKNPYGGVANVIHTFSFALYPWVCENDPAMVNNNFTSPSMDSYGVNNGWKCYADNEPMGSSGWPPFIELYFAGLFKESDDQYVLRLDKWMINNSDTPQHIDKGYALYPCSSGDHCEK